MAVGDGRALRERRAGAATDIGLSGARRVSSLADLNADPHAGRQIYELGYVIGEFIVTRWGRAGLLDLIRARGDVNAVFGVTPGAFEAEMYAWIRTKYL